MLKSGFADDQKSAETMDNGKQLFCYGLQFISQNLTTKTNVFCVTDKKVTHRSFVDG